MRAGIALGVAALILLSGCADWREGPESVESCMKRHAPKAGAANLLKDDSGVWVPAYTYDITKMENLHAFGREIQERGGTFQFVGWEPSNEPPASVIQGQRDRWLDTPATLEGAVLLTVDPAHYKVRGKPGPYQELLRQGCEGQRTGMRLISWQSAKADKLVDDKLPAGPTAAEIRAVQELNSLKIKDLLP